MSKLKSFLGILLALVSIIVVLAAFMATGPLASLMARLPFMRVDPLYTGGEVIASYVLETAGSSALEVRIHQGVFRSFLGTPSTGYRQVDFVPREGQALPAVIRAALDLDRDGGDDVTLLVDTSTGRSSLEDSGGSCYSLQASSRVHEGWIVRIRVDQEAASCASCRSSASCPLRKGTGR